MIRHGVAPFLECSSRGDKRFSAFHARIKAVGNRTIEDIYQATKMINGCTGLTWREAKGKKPDNAEYCALYYSWLWDIYIYENPDLLPVLRSATGLSDMFGQDGHCCQATELWRIRGRTS